MTHVFVEIKFNKNISVKLADQLFSDLENDWYREGIDSTEYESIGLNSDVEMNSIKDDLRCIFDFAEKNYIAFYGKATFTGDHSFQTEFAIGCYVAHELGLA